MEVGMENTGEKKGLGDGWRIIKSSIQLYDVAEF
jgi:hypothetical protein